MDIEKAKARAANLLRLIDKVLAEEAKAAADDGVDIIDSLGGALLALVVHANCYVKILSEKDVADEDMDKLSDLSADWAEEVFRGYLVSSVVTDPGAVVPGPVGHEDN